MARMTVFVADQGICVNDHPLSAPSLSPLANPILKGKMLSVEGKYGFRSGTFHVDYKK